MLRGSIDSGEYKSYIFGLLFFKRLSDAWVIALWKRLFFSSRSTSSDSRALDINLLTVWIVGPVL